MLVRFSKALAFITGFLLQHAIGAQDGFGQLLEPICTNISTHDYVPPDVSFANFESILQSLNFNVSLQGIFNIAARYYEPQRLYLFPNQFNTLQFLVHGETYTRNYCSGDGAPRFGCNSKEYGWITYASGLAYATLSIDRIGNGLSDHPDLWLAVQVPTNIEITYTFLTNTRAGSLLFLRVFDKVILVGHSIGSLVVNQLTAKYPTYTDASVLTGFGKSLDFGSGLKLFDLEPAAEVQTPRYGSLAPGYLDAANQSGVFAELFHPGGYGVAFAEYDYSICRILTWGECLTVYPATTIPTESTNPVYMISEQRDVIFCDTGVNSTADCDPTPSVTCILAQTRTMYPNGPQLWP